MVLIGIVHFAPGAMSGFDERGMDLSTTQDNPVFGN
jgi:hypothetical protein